MKRHLIAAAAAVAASLVLVGCGDDGGFTYDEAAHQAAAEQLMGHPFRNAAAWQQWKGAAENACDQTGTDYEAYVAVWLDDGLLDELRLDAEHMCPEKTEIIEATLVDLGYEPDHTDQ